MQQVFSYLSVCPILIFHFPGLPVQVSSVLVLVTSNQSSGPNPLAVTVFRKTTNAYKHFSFLNTFTFLGKWLNIKSYKVLVLLLISAKSFGFRFQKTAINLDLTTYNNSGIQIQCRPKEYVSKLYCHEPLSNGLLWNCWAT